MASLKKLRVAVDVDGVLAETMEAWCANYNRLYGRNLTLQDINTWSSWKKLGVEQNVFYRLLNGAWDKWREIPPTEPDLSEKVRKSERYGFLDIVTGRAEHTVPAVKQWLRHYGIPYDNFVRVRGWRYKILPEYDVYIDDAPELMPMISKSPSLHGILYQRPWNMDVPELPRIVRVETWNEIPGILKKILNEDEEGSEKTRSGTARKVPAKAF